MSVLIVGSTALDSIKTPRARHARLLGGSASYAAVAASFFAPVKMVGVGDCFVGGMMGYLSAAAGPVAANLRRAILYGSVLASYCCEGFGLKALTRVTQAAIARRQCLPKIHLRLSRLVDQRHKHLLPVRRHLPHAVFDDRNVIDAARQLVLNRLSKG